MAPAIHERLLPVIAIVAASALLVWVIYDIAYRVLVDTSEDTRSRSTTQTVTKSAKEYQINDIVNVHLFGKVQQQIVQKTEAPRTRLRLKLVGMLASADPKQAIALIASDNGPAISYRVGETIKPSGAKLKSVEPSKVIIERSGRLESLHIERPTIDDPNKGITQQSRAGSSTANANPDPSPPPRNAHKTVFPKVPPPKKPAPKPQQQ